MKLKVKALKQCWNVQKQVRFIITLNGGREKSIKGDGGKGNIYIKRLSLRCLVISSINFHNIMVSLSLFINED